MTINIDINIVINILLIILFFSSIVMKLYFFARAGLYDWFSKLYVGSVMVSIIGLAMSIAILGKYLNILP